MCRSALMMLAATCFAGCAAPQPPDFLSPEDKFRVRFGHPPKVYDRDDNGIPTRFFTVSTPDGAFTVRTYELPVAADAATQATDKLLADARDDLIRRSKAKQTASEPVTLAGKYPGLWFAATVAEPEPGLLRGRVYLAGNRLYKVTASGTHAFVNAPEATAFLDSFMVTE